ncbi:MAG: PEP-CTERM sorting domain-containing protein, partial [Planctomycetales bacterium]|nr:PEP-CTERM sorting domain-containing protein [Planctomycetales bacterium]
VGPTGAFIDLSVFVGSPTYANVSDRPGASSGELGASFDGTSYLEGARLGRPSTSISDISQGGPLDYTGVGARGFQFWVKPQNNTTLQSVVLDANQFGVQITDTGFWSMRFGGGNTVTEIPVNVGEWTHVMLVSPIANGSTMYVNGVVAASVGGGYQNDDLPLNVGGVTDNGGGVAEGFVGVIDNLEMFVLGEPPFTNASYGTFDLATDNDYVASLGLTAGDVDGDHDVDDDDVTQFIANWREEQRVGGGRVGDLNSRANGDLNFDGITNFGDWAILRANHPNGSSLTLAGLQVPEPTGLLLSLAAASMLVKRRR